MEDGRRQVLRFLLTGDAIISDGEMIGVRYVGVRSGILYDLTDASIARCKCRPMTSEAWRVLQNELRLRAIVRHIVMLGRYSAEERIADFLNDLVERIGVKEGDAYALSLPMGREDIADHLGMKAETVSRQLGRLKKNAIIDLLKPGQVVVKDRKRLVGLIPHFADVL